MNKLFLTAVVFFLSLTSVMAQEDDLKGTLKILGDAAEAVSTAPRVEDPKTPKSKYWKKSLMTKIDFGQTSLTNWAAGGYNTVTLKAFIDGTANYQKNDMFWNNRLQLDYGFVYSADKPVLQKSDDRFYFESKWGYQAVKTLYLSAEFNFKSQFSDSYTYPKSLPEGFDSTDPKAWKENRTLKSAAMSPAYTTLGIGLDYNPLKWLTVNFAPLTGGLVIVDKPELRKSYSMPVRKKYEDADLSEDEKNLGRCYKSVKFEFGAQLKIDIKVNVNDNFKYTSQVLLFSDYLQDPEKPRINWDNRFDWKLTKFFSLSFTTNLIYDDKVLIKNDKDIEKYPDGKQRVQFKESLAFGFVYTFAR